MRFSSSEILTAAKTSGFREDVVEKVLCLMHLLNMLNSHTSLKGKWVLKGGTALNLFVLRLPRLSVDIDLNYIGTLDREDMLEDQIKIKQAAQAIFSREGLAVRRVPSEHAGGKWRLNYQSFTGKSANLEVDMNFMYRQPLWEIDHLDSYPLGDFQAKNIPILDLHELVAGKLSALFSRRQARDLFDCHRILNAGNLQQERLRVAFVVYGGMNRKDWRTISVEDVDYQGEELIDQLTPTLHTHLSREQSSSVKYGTKLVDECRKALSVVLPFTDAEKAFLNLLLDEGEIDATILTSDPTLQKRIQAQPQLQWKALNVKRHKRLS